VFSILDTAAGEIASYAFDTTKPDGPVPKIDAFSVGRSR
jgi:hypothetical protein